jgi:hypothetical protein
MTHPTHATRHPRHTDALPYATAFGTAGLCAALLAAMGPERLGACVAFSAVALACAWRALDLAALHGPAGQGATLGADDRPGGPL